MKTFLRIIIIVASVLVFILGAVCLAVSPTAKYIINNYGPKIVGRTMQADDVSINLLSGRVVVDGFKLYEAEDSTLFISLNKFDTKANLWRLMGQTVDISHLTFDALDVNIIQNGSQFNFDDIIAFYAPTDSLAADTTAVAAEKSQWNIELNNIAFNEGYVHYYDAVLDATLGLRNLNLIIPALYFSNRNSDVDVEFNLDEGGRLRTHLEYCVEQGDFNLHLNLDSLNLGSLQPYIRQSFNIGDFAGTLNAAADIAGNLNHIMDFNAAGTLDLCGLCVNDTEGAPLANIDNLHIGMSKLSLLNRICHFDVIRMRGANVTVVYDKQGNMNLNNILKEEETTEESANEPSTEEEESAPFEIRIGDLDLRGIGVDYTDHTLRKTFSYSLSEITLRSRNFDLAGTNRAVLTARLGNSGRANISWNGTLHDLDNQKLNVKVENVRMADFSPFCYEYTSYPLTAGNMTFSSDNVVSKSRLSSKNALDVYQCTAGHKDKSYKADYSNIPVRMGLYLLKDMDEHIKMDIPISGTLGSPEFSFRKIMFKTIGNAMLKVVASPFVFLKGNDNNLKDIPFDPVSSSFTTQQYESLTTIADAIKAKPEMQITLRQHTNVQGLQQTLELLALKRDYHNSLTDQPTDQLSPMDTERIAALSFSNVELEAYADTLLIRRGMAADTTANFATKRSKLYAERAAGQIEMLKQMRNRTIRDYVVGQQGVADSLFRVEDITAEAQAAYKGKSRYTIEVAVGGESITIGSEENQTEL
ncbi:MAG: DUF748 domain-containing protein [Rikenellaceae bacterium]|nr:DUF748 domain-containing protein [Rikenellaceae bacterium]